MAIDRKKSLLEDLRETLTEEFDKGLIDAYVKNLDYRDLERTFVEQLIEEVKKEDET